ncbi:MAG: hypothetical protein IJV18_02120 [Acidaminococcaceae bacterium]|nr:hypothetical protein [Acidaminococcaceae bacterium]
MKAYRTQDNWKEKFENLQELFREMSDYLEEVVTDRQNLAESNEYLNDYIAYKGLEEEFSYFRENAHKDDDETTPFPRYVM